MLKVSVVVPVYNTGHYLEKCLESLVGQSLPPEEYEVIFVDDGSTDRVTPDRMDRAAREHPQVKAIHIPNSGWPGKPRNVGIDIAAGEYVYFVDHDDWLAPEALERMYDFASANHADVIIGKIVGHGRRVARTLFERSYPSCTALTAPLMESLTPHKGFRRDFLNEHRLRFPEGKRRLEDHVFVTEAYLRAEVVSVLSDYACYHHIARDDKQNAGFQEWEPKSYYRDLRQAVKVAESLTRPGPDRAAVLRRWLRVELLGRVGGKPFLTRPPQRRLEMYRAIRRLARRHFTDPEIVAGLAPQFRARDALLRADDFDGLIRLAEFESGLALDQHLDGVRAAPTTLELTVSASVVTADGDPLVIDPGPDPKARFSVAGLDKQVLPLRRSEPVKVDLICRGRTTKTSKVITVDAEFVASPDGSAEWCRGTLTLPVDELPGLAEGELWDVFVRLRQWFSNAPGLRARIARGDTGPELTADTQTSDGLRIRPFWTRFGNLSLIAE